jgi:hypothetical protein
MREGILMGALVAGAVSVARPATAQVVFTSDAGAFNAYIWRGVTLTNQFVVQPDAYLTIPAGGGALVFGAWGNIDAGQYDDPVEDISQGGGTSSFNATEVDVWAEYGRALRPGLSGTIGGLLYLYPNDAGFTNKVNRTLEIYGKLQATSMPLVPKLAVWYDVDKVDGFYLEASLAQPVKAISGFPLTFGALAGFSGGQGTNQDDPSQIANFADDGFTHADLSATGALSAGPVIIAPTVHLLLLNDGFTELTKPGVTKDVKAWAGVTLTWSKAITRVTTTVE